LIVCLLLSGPLSPWNLGAQDGWDDSGTEVQAFRPEELDQMLAPVALYPDPLLSKVLMAATYPSEVEEAAKFAYDNSGLDGETLSALATGEDWDPSVKGLLEFPDILGMMYDRIEWTREMGDAFLGQQRDTMDSIQRLRANACNAGTLVSTKEQTVRTQSGAATDSIEIDPVTYNPVTFDPILIEPVDMEWLYAPVYDPETVYGDWWWSGYPPYYYYPPAWSPGTGIGFWAGVAVGRNWDWSGWNWSRREATVDIGRYNGWTQKNYADPGRYQRAAGAGPQNWRHDPSHRMDDAYRDRATAQRFGQGDRFRGSGQAGQGGTARRATQGGDRGFDRGGASPDRRPADFGNRSAFDGAGAGGGDRAASFRGQASRGPAGGGFGGGGGRRR
jgi:hypothetical protein